MTKITNKLAISMELNSKQSILTKLLSILEDKDKGE